MDWRPFLGLTRKAFELRDRDKDGCYRVIYVSIIKNVIHVLHAFKKNSNRTPQKDVVCAIQRLKQVELRLARAKKEDKHD